MWGGWECGCALSFPPPPNPAEGGPPTPRGGSAPSPPATPSAISAPTTRRQSRRGWSPIRTAEPCGARTCLPWPRTRWKRRKTALPTALRLSGRTRRASLAPGAGRTQPIAGIQCDAALAANFEMQVGAFVARLTADVADQLAANDVVTLMYGRVVQIGVERVVAAAMVDQHRREV